VFHKILVISLMAKRSNRSKVNGIEKYRRNATLKRVAFKGQNDGEKSWPSSH
jgi:hypothetical protein